MATTTSEKNEMFRNVKEIDSQDDKTEIVFIRGIVKNKDLDRYNEWFEETYSHPIEIDWRDPYTVWIWHKGES